MFISEEKPIPDDPTHSERKTTAKWKLQSRKMLEKLNKDTALYSR